MSTMNHNSEYLKLLKIPVWQLRGQEDLEMVEPLSQAEALPIIEPVTIPVVPYVESQSAPQLGTLCLDNCTACQLHNGRTQVIKGKGSKSARIVVITEAPTFNEDISGAPLAEEAGKLFENILKSIGCKLEDVYITPYVKCVPAHLFITEAEEEQCHHHLMNELNEIQPQKILLLGRNVAKYLLKTTQSFDVARHQDAHLNILGTNVPVYVSYNPYQLLKFPEEKRKVWNDIKKLIK